MARLDLTRNLLLCSAVLFAASCRRSAETAPPPVAAPPPNAAATAKPPAPSVLPAAGTLAPGTLPMPAIPGTATAAAPAIPPPPLDGPQLYSKYCTLCHGPAAQGYAADNAPSLVSPTYVATAADDFVRTAIERGRPGTAMGGYGAMVGGPLGRPEMDRLMEYLKGLAPVPRVALPSTKIRGSAKKGQALFEKNCQTCHGSPLQRATAVHLFNPVLLATASDAYLKYAVESGRPGTKMEPWKGKLPPRAIDDVIAYLRSVAPKDLQAALATASGQEPARPIKGPIVVNPKGKQADLKLKDDRLVPIADVKAALDARRRLIFVDARTPSDYQRLHITGAISIPYYDMKEIDKLPKDGTWIIAYCACPHHASGVVYEELRKRGYKTSAVLDEGVFAWQQKGYPVVAAPGTLPIPAPPTAAMMNSAGAMGTAIGTAGTPGGVPLPTGALPPPPQPIVPSPLQLYPRPSPPTAPTPPPAAPTPPPH